MKIELIKSNNFSKYTSIKKNNNLNNNTIKSKNENTAYISSLINEKYEKENQLEQLKQYRKEHIAELEDIISDIKNSIDEINKLSEKNINENDNWTDKLSQKDLDENNNLTDELSQKDLDENNNLTDELSQKDLDENNNLTDELLQKDLDENNNLTDELLQKDLDENDNLTDELSPKDNNLVLTPDSNCIDLIKLLYKYKVELKMYKETSAEEIKNIQKEIERINNKISNAKQQKNSDNFIDAFI
ncbi:MULTISPECIES: hypothetical protein [Clostridium]|uniref:hypothetical protein n=1 Tax=Clostridium TaxID=1485 RepID=UPI0028FD86A0|nr:MULTISPECIES: hypothetical protein [Clostridium]MDU0323389.1 hypothetical protein [Clostridium butyricum]MDU1070091.1 hypothetical protein [Clostridium sp.]MDU2678285.1 hypothetical protein [Clostridium sp.]MDU4212719.1 hypothetical protein [Clostridium sp.]MDU5175341.1 hypothetical protein [Clostridium sp.]